MKFLTCGNYSTGALNDFKGYLPKNIKIIQDAIIESWNAAIKKSAEIATDGPPDYWDDDDLLTKENKLKIDYGFEIADEILKLSVSSEGEEGK